MSALMHDFSCPVYEPSNQKWRPYLGGSHGRAVAVLSQTALRRDEILLFLSGPAGVGKSVVLNAALEALGDKQIRIIHIGNPDGRAWSQRDLAHQILNRSLAAAADLPMTNALGGLSAASENASRQP